MRGPWPVIVVGPGRCGSSTVAGWLRELGVDMGSRFREANETNPNGFWEDLDFVDANQAAIEGKLKPEWYAWIIDGLVLTRRAEQRPWGFKDPRICHLLKWALPVIDECRFIRLFRPHEDVVASMVRCYQWSYEHACKLAVQRECLLEDDLPTTVPGDRLLCIDFAQIVDGSAKKRIQEWL